MHAGTPAVPCTEQKGTKTVPPPHFLTLCLPPRFICERGSPRGTGTTAVTHGQPGGDTAAEGQWLRTPGGNQAGPARPPPPRLLLLLQAPDKEAAPGRAPRSGGLVLPLLLLPLFLNPSYKTMRRAPAPQPPHRSWRAGGTAPGFAAPPRAGQGSRVGLGRAAFSRTPPWIQPLLSAEGRGAAGWRELPPSWHHVLLILNVLGEAVWGCPGLFSGGEHPHPARGSGGEVFAAETRGWGAMLVRPWQPERAHLPTAHPQPTGGDKARRQARGEGKIPWGRGWGAPSASCLPCQHGTEQPWGRAQGWWLRSWDELRSWRCFEGKLPVAAMLSALWGLCGSCFAEMPSESVLGLSYSLGK